MNKKKLAYDMWAILDGARDLAYILKDETAIKELSILRRKYLKLSGVGDKVILELSKKLNK